LLEEQQRHQGRRRTDPTGANFYRRLSRGQIYWRGGKGRDHKEGKPTDAQAKILRSHWPCSKRSPDERSEIRVLSFSHHHTPDFPRPALRAAGHPGY